MVAKCMKVKNMVKTREDLTSRVFGDLTVLYQDEDYVNKNGVHFSMWRCRCECGCKDCKKEVSVRGALLKNHTRIDCGCSRNRKISKSLQKQNEYEICGDYVIMYTSKHEPFLVSIEDFWKVRNISWYINKQGYVVNKTRKNGGVLLSRLIMDCPADLLVDHRNGDKTNNIRDNLRLATHSENTMNHKLSGYNSSGVTGVSWNKRDKKWESYIGKDGTRNRLGYFDDFESAVKARKEAEEVYFGKWSYDNSRKENK